MIVLFKRLKPSGCEAAVRIFRNDRMVFHKIKERNKNQEVPITALSRITSWNIFEACVKVFNSRLHKRLLIKMWWRCLWCAIHPTPSEWSAKEFRGTPTVRTGLKALTFGPEINYRRSSAKGGASKRLRCGIIQKEVS